MQYDTGLTDFNNVLVTQRDLFSQQDQLVASEAEVIVNLITLYKALGGGWDLDDSIDLPDGPMPTQDKPFLNLQDGSRQAPGICSYVRSLGIRSDSISGTH